MTRMKTPGPQPQVQLQLCKQVAGGLTPQHTPTQRLPTSRSRPTSNRRWRLRSFY